MQGRLFNRKTNPKVKGGKVQKKNDHRKTPWRGFVVDRVSPAKGYRHLVTKREIFDFIELLPDWRELIHGIERIRLTSGSESTDATYTHFNREGTGLIELFAWQKDLVQEIPHQHFDAHRSIFERIELKFERKKEDVVCWFDEAKAKAFILVHIFTHELGHHHDRMNAKRHTLSRGEDYAETFANRLEDGVWPKYVAKFGKP